MKKKLGAVLLVVALVLALVLPAAPVSADPISPILWAGQNINVGTVSVWNDGTDLHVKYETTGDWVMIETHLEVVANPEDFPQTKKGNPIPGHFTYGTEHDPAVTEYEVVISGFNVGNDVLIAAHAEVVKVIIIDEAPYYASTVISSWQGLTKGGGAVRVQRSNPDNALDYEAGQNEANFFSLGSGGWIILEYDCPIPNGDGNDIQVIEDTWGTYPLETADVYASQDGSTWKYLGEADNTNNVGIHTISEFDLDGILEWAKYIKVVDTTDPTLHNNSADGFDLNAVASLQDCIEVVDEETAWGDGERFTDKGNWATYFGYTLQGPIGG